MHKGLFVMKCQLFSRKTLEVMKYLKTHLPSDTYWCEDMMQMMLYLVDWVGHMKLNRQITDLEWKTNGTFVLEAGGLEEVEHWEEHVPSYTFITRWQKKLFGSWDRLSSEELNVLDRVVKRKKADDIRIGSYSLRHFIHSTKPLNNPSRSKQEVVHIDFSESDEDEFDFENSKKEAVSA